MQHTLLYLEINPSRVVILMGIQTVKVKELYVNNTMEIRITYQVADGMIK